MLRFSTGLRQFIAGGGSWRQALANGRVMFFSGAQPANPDVAPTGTLLCTFTKDGNDFTAESCATATIELTGGAAGSVDSVTVGGMPLFENSVAFDTDLSTTATALAAAINSYQNSPDFTATVSGTTVTIIAPKGTGALFNSIAVSVATTTITDTSDAVLSGGVSAVNGLLFGAPSSGVLPKEPGVVWQANPVATGSAGYFRYVGSSDDAFGDSSTAIRIDGSIATSGADLNMDSTAIAIGTPQTINTFNVTIPASKA